MALSKTTNKEDDSEKKVFDVAKPGSSNPETGTKPMVIGHKTLPSDPSMINQEDTSSNKDEDSSSESQPTIGLSPSSKKLRLQPLSEDEKNGTPSDDTDQEKDENTPTDVEISEATETKVEEKAPDLEPETQKTTSELEKDKQDVVDEREEKLRELIKSGKYNVSIRESKGFNLKVFIVTFLLTGVLLIVILAVLIDLDIIDFGISLPFDVL